MRLKKNNKVHLYSVALLNLHFQKSQNSQKDSQHTADFTYKETICEENIKTEQAC